MEYEVTKKLNRDADYKQHNALHSTEKALKLMSGEGSEQITDGTVKLQKIRFKLDEERSEDMKLRKGTVARRQAVVNRVHDVYDSRCGLPEINSTEQRSRQKEADLMVYNKKLTEQKQYLEKSKVNNEMLILKQGQRQQDEADLKKHQSQMKFKKAQMKNAADHKKEMERRETKAKKVESDVFREYKRQLHTQLDKLVSQNELTESQVKTLYQKDLQEQIDYTRLLMERAWHKELETQYSMKSDLATPEFHEEIQNMMSRAFREKVHPFRRPMASCLKMKEKYASFKPPTQVKLLDSKNKI